MHRALKQPDQYIIAIKLETVPRQLEMFRLSSIVLLNCYGITDDVKFSVSAETN